MKSPYDLRRLRPWELVLAGVAVCAPLLLPLASNRGPAFVGTAIAQDMQKADTTRLVSVGGAVTEIVYALGEEGRLVGRDSTSVYPPAATSLPDVGYMRQLSAEGVMAINPSAIIATVGSGPPETLTVLGNAGIPFRMVPETHNREGILAKIRAVGDFLGVPEKAATLAGKVEADLDTAIADAASRPENERKRVLFILSMQDGKILASGTKTAADGIIALSGALNATGTFSGYKALSDEAIIEAKPDVILMMTRSGGHAATNEELFAHPALRLTPAAKNQAAIRMDGLHLLGFGPRTAGAVRELNAAIYGKNPNASQ